MSILNVNVFCVIRDCRWWKPTTCAIKGISWPKNKGLGSILCDMSMSQLVLSDPTEGDMGKSRKVLPTRPFGTSTPVSSTPSPSLYPPKEMFIIPHRSLPSPLNKSQASEQDKATNCTKQPQKLTHSKSREQWLWIFSKNSTLTMCSKMTRLNAQKTRPPLPLCSISNIQKRRTTTCRTWKTTSTMAMETTMATGGTLLACPLFSPSSLSPSSGLRSGRSQFPGCRFWYWYFPNIYLFHLFRFSKHLSPSPLIRVLKVTSGLADAAGWFYQTPCHIVTMSPCHLVTLSPCHLFTLSHFTTGELGFSRHFPPPQPLVLLQEHLACLSPPFLGSPVGGFMISALLAISSCRWWPRPGCLYFWLWLRS